MLLQRQLLRLQHDSSLLRLQHPRLSMLQLRHNVIAYAACASFVYVAFTASQPSDTYAAFVTLSIGGLGLGE